MLNINHLDLIPNSTFKVLPGLIIFLEDFQVFENSFTEVQEFPGFPRTV